jgi:hypothetical protein
MTAPVAVVNFMNYEGWEWGKIAAGGTMVMLPVLFFSILVRKFLVHGLTAGALKGEAADQATSSMGNTPSYSARSPIATPRSSSVVQIHVAVWVLRTHLGTIHAAGTERSKKGVWPDQAKISSGSCR